MATLLLSAVGAGVGQALGSTAFGMSMAGIGQFVGATYGRAIDTQLFSQGAAPVQQDHVENFRLTGAGEGAPIPYVLGLVRVPGHIIWASHFTEDVDITGGTAGSKGMPPNHGRGQDVGKTDQSGPSGKCGHVWVCHAVVGDYTVRAKILP